MPEASNASPIPASPEATALLSLAHRSPRLELSSVDLCFLAALYLRAKSGGIYAFAEAELFEWFEHAAEICTPDASQLRRRATHSIARLREQQLLSRVDGAGLTRAGEYALTRLGTSIVTFFLEDEALTTETLTLLTGTLESSLRGVLESARAARGVTEIQAKIVGPLRVTVHELMQGIERRQRGLDQQQEQFQKRIASLLESDWFGAIEQCQTLLETTTATLRDLNHVLLSEAHRLGGLLEDLQELTIDAGASGAEQAVAQAAEQISRISAWSSGRQKSWSEYYQYVHRFLRDVVRLDPARALTARLRDQLSGKSGKQFALTVAMTPAPLLLRELAVPRDLAPVRRPRTERAPALEDISSEDPLRGLESSVLAAFARGASGLTEVTREVLLDLPEELRFLAAGRVVEIVARVTHTHAARVRPWVAVDEAFAIEEWSLDHDKGES